MSIIYFIAQTGPELVFRSCVYRSIKNLISTWQLSNICNIIYQLKKLNRQNKLTPDFNLINTPINIPWLGQWAWKADGCYNTRLFTSAPLHGARRRNKPFEKTFCRVSIYPVELDDMQSVRSSEAKSSNYCL